MKRALLLCMVLLPPRHFPRWRWERRARRWPDDARVRPMLQPAEDVDTADLKSPSPAIARALEDALERPGRSRQVMKTRFGIIQNRPLRRRRARPAQC